MAVRYEIWAVVGAAEATISAAAEALVWSTGDAHGVLTHVAAADPTLMAATRLVYERLAAGRDVTTNLREQYRTTPMLFDEVAALPWLVAREWTSQVNMALRERAYLSGTSTDATTPERVQHSPRWITPFMRAASGAVTRCPSTASCIGRMV